MSIYIVAKKLPQCTLLEFTKRLYIVGVLFNFQEEYGGLKKNTLRFYFSQTHIKTHTQTYHMDCVFFTIIMYILA